MALQQHSESNHGQIFPVVNAHVDKIAHAQFTPQGFTWDLAATYHSLLIFIEHRYYGKSLPFGPLSYQDPSHLNYLSSGQALADYATVITDIKVAIIHISHMYYVV